MPRWKPVTILAAMSVVRGQLTPKTRLQYTWTFRPCQ